MSSGYTMIPATGLPGQSPNRDVTKPKTAEAEATDDVGPLQFVTTTSTVAIDESSKRAIRKHASRYVYRAKPQPSQSGANPAVATRRTPKAAAGGQIHRFRLGPQGLKHTPNQPPQVSQNFTILSLKSDEPEPKRPVTQAPPGIGTSTGSGTKSSLSKRSIAEDVEDEELGNDSSTSIAFNEYEDLFEDQSSLELVRQSRGKQGTWLEPLMFTQGGSLFDPSSGTMDPFNAMALPITPREQILLRYYFMDHRQVDSPLIPYCRAWFGLAVQDRAYLHAVLSHYSATHRQRFQEESPVESFSHLTAAIRLITERLQDPKESCSNGTIGAVASLIIYESFNGAIPSIEFHMRGLKEMVRRRGGLDIADFPMDLKRLIAWTDLNTANDLWQKPRFPAIELPTDSGTSTLPDIWPQDNLAFPTFSNLNSTQAQYSLPSLSQSLIFSPTSASVDLPQTSNSLTFPQSSTSFTQATQPTIDTVLIELKAFAIELEQIRKSLNPLNRPHISTSDKVHRLERRIFDLIHSPPPSHTPLDRACAVAALIYMRSNIRDYICNFRIIETAKLQTELMKLGDLWQWGNELRDREKLVWTVGFGAVSSGGRPEREWFVRMFRHVCESLGLGRWEYVKAVFETVLWKRELDAEGVRVWEEMGMEVRI